MGLSPRTGISIFEIIFYIPVTIIGIILVLRHGFKRDLGWIFLAIFGTIRILGSTLFIVASQSPSNTSLLVAALVFQAVGLSPLFFATSGFLGVVAKNSEFNVPTRLTRLIRVALIVAIALSVVAGTDSTKANQSQDITFKKVSTLLLLAIFLVLVLLHAYYWLNVNRIVEKARRMLLAAISCALPFIGVRLAYSLAGAWESSQNGPFNLVTGSIAIYAIMVVVMECIAILIYITAGLLLPLDKGDYDGARSGNSSQSGSYPMMSNSAYGQRA